MIYEIYENGVKMYVSDYVYYCTNKDGEGLFRVDLQRNDRRQLKGTCQFSVYGLKNKSKKAKIKKTVQEYLV